MDNEKAEKIIETVLFISDMPVSLENLRNVLDGMEKEEIVSRIEALNNSLSEHPIEVVEIAGGYQLRTKSEYGDYVKKFHKMKRSTRLSPASLEVLSIVSYKQPITRHEIEDIRGVDSTGIVKKLLEKNLVKTMGRKKIAGKPMTFGTSKKFLEYFGLVRLADLPTLKDFPEDIEVDGDQGLLGLESGSDTGEKDEIDLQIEKEAAMVEPADEDYDDDIEDDDIDDDEPDNADNDNETIEEMDDESNEFNEETTEEEQTENSADEEPDEEERGS